ncbi:MAG: S8 family serine peptidase [Dysgonamonadaceae bacterium]|jgi:subtilisin family serine protease|nr:S8 family serine peptidase [Dysgonamonadaceae bacterium]
MKKIIVAFGILFFCLSVFAQSDFFYGTGGEKIHFKIRKDMVLVKAKQEAKENISSLFKNIEINNPEFIIATIDTAQIQLKSLQQNQDITDITYMLEYSDGVLQAPTEGVFVKCREGQTIDKVMSKVDLQKVVKSIRLINSKQQIFRAELNVSLNDIMDAAIRLYETGLVEFAEPDFMRLLHPAANPYFPNQWGLENTGQYGGIAGYDIKAESAWGITKGDSNIKIAVIDEGVELTHPDLSGNLLSGFDATTGSSSGSGGGPQAGDYHGTCCAGIAAALDNNIGIIGVAPSCKIIPIRIAYNNSSGNWVTYDSWIKNGIEYAWSTADADVLSNSWGGGAPSSTITSEIQNAVTYGRNGKGSLVVFCSMNGNSAVAYPASLSTVIAVGAISQCGERKSFSSCDGEGWGSNYGTNLDIIAPGVKIYTTTLNGNYISDFNGTSAACPHVAGVAALVLSVNPNLIVQQVRNIIESTAQKVRPDLYTYSTTSGHPNGTWNNEMGYGLVNAYAAVQAAASSCVDNFINQTVSTNQTVVGCDDLTVQNVTVTNNAQLKLEASGEVTINGLFEVQSGSVLEIK